MSQATFSALIMICFQGSSLVSPKAFAFSVMRTFTPVGWVAGMVELKDNRKRRGNRQEVILRPETGETGSEDKQVPQQGSQSWCREIQESI